MMLKDTIETYSYFITEANAMGLAYVCLVRYAAKLDTEFDGKQIKLFSRAITPTTNLLRKEACNAA